MSVSFSRCGILVAVSHLTSVGPVELQSIQDLRKMLYDLCAITFFYACLKGSTQTNFFLDFIHSAKSVYVVSLLNRDEEM